MIPTPDKLGLYYPSKDLTEPGTDLAERSVKAGSTTMAVMTDSITQSTGYWDGALGFFYGPTTQPELRGQTFHVRKWVKDEGCLYITSPLPVMHSIRALENKIQTTICRTCRDRNKTSEIDRSSLDLARRLLAECSDDKARLVKEAAGIVQYRVQYHDLSGSVREIVR